MNNRIAFALLFAAITAFSVRYYTSTEKYERIKYDELVLIPPRSELKNKSDKQLENEGILRTRIYSNGTSLLGLIGGFGFGYLVLGLRRRGVVNS